MPFPSHRRQTALGASHSLYVARSSTMVDRRDKTGGGLLPVHLPVKLQAVCAASHTHCAPAALGRPSSSLCRCRARAGPIAVSRRITRTALQRPPPSERFCHNDSPAWCLRLTGGTKVDTAPGPARARSCIRIVTSLASCFRAETSRRTLVSELRLEWRRPRVPRREWQVRAVSLRVKSL